MIFWILVACLVAVVTLVITRPLLGAAPLAPEDPDAVTARPDLALVITPEKTEEPAGSGDIDESWACGLFRLAIEPTDIDRERAYERLASAVHHFLTRRPEGVKQETLVRAAGVLRRVRGWALEDAYSVSAPYHVACLAHAFAAWHHYRELSRAVDVRNDLVVEVELAPVDVGG